jgi:hypothetical protein
MENKERLQLFLDELTTLTNKYGIEIGGCGCCNSPYLIDLTNGDNEFDGQLTMRSWDGDKLDKYTTESV